MSEADAGLSDLPDGWAWTTLGEIIKPSKEKVNPLEIKEIPYISLEHIEKGAGRLLGHGSSNDVRSSKTKFNCGDLLYGKLRPYLNKVYISDFEGVCSTDLLVFPKNESFSNEFLLYRFLCRDFVSYASHNVSGVNLPRVNFQTLSRFKIALPPLPEQHRIVAKIEELFTKLDAGIIALHKVQAQLKRYRQSVLKAAFEGKLTEAWRAEHQDEIEPASVLLKRVLKERREKWEAEQLEQMKAKGKIPKDEKWKSRYKEPAAPDTSELSELPKQWVWATVEELLTKIQYGSSRKTSDDANGVPVLRMGNIVEGKIVPGSLKYLPKEHDEFPELLLNKGDLLFNRTNSRELVVKTAVYTGSPNQCSFASYLIRVRFNSGIDALIVAHYLNSMYGKNWILSVVSQQAGQANVNGTKLKLLSVPIPPEEEQQTLVEEVDRCFSMADVVERIITAELKRAEQLRQSILKKAFSGALVPQNPNDEPVSVLLERIKTEKP